MTSDRLWTWLPIIYALISIPAVVFISMKFPLFQHADEHNHFLRAEQISGGGLLGQKLANGSAGGSVDESALISTRSIRLLKRGECADEQHPQEVNNINWSGNRIPASFSNTAIYPPIPYLPVTAGIIAGKFMGLSVVDTVYLARLTNGLASIAIGFLALRLCVRGRYLMFTVLLLPMTLALFASMSQDAVLIASGCLLAASLSRLLEPPRERGTRKLLALLLALSFFVVSTSKLPYIFLALIFALPPVVGAWASDGNNLSRAKYILPVLVFILPVAAWTLYVTTYVGVPLNPGKADVGAQIQHLLWNPTAVFSIARRTLEGFSIYYYQGFVGLLGNWLDARFPVVYYFAAAVALFGSWLLSTTEGDRTKPVYQIVISLSVLLTIFGTFAALYLAYTWVGARYVDGVQGRYFLPLAGMFALLGPGGMISGNTRRLFSLYVLTFPLLTVALAPQVISQRYHYCGV
jgi:uncharacterized membrane protein